MPHNPATCSDCRRYIGRPSEDGDATGGGPQINAENAAEYGEGE